MLKNSFLEKQGVVAGSTLLFKESDVILKPGALVAKVTIISTLFTLTPLTIIGGK